MASRNALPPARRAALACLRATFSKETPLQAALNHVLQQTPLSPRDQGLCTELCYGYLRRKLRLDHLIDAHLKRPGIPEGIRLVLGVAAFELTELSRVPAYASVDWAVREVRRQGGKGLGNLANAVLRAIDRLGDTVHDPEFFGAGKVEEALFLSRFYSCPEWIVRLWMENYPKSTSRALLTAQASPPELGFRIVSSHQDAPAARELIHNHPQLVSHEGPAAALSAGSDITSLLPFLESGALARQSAASQQALFELAPGQWPGPVWDCCAGRGGKTRLLLDLGRDDLWASDVNAGRLAELQQDRPDLSIFRARAQHVPLKARPGTVLVDAPCSGLGVLSRRPDAKYKRRPKDLKNLARLQDRILASVFDALASGGRLAYLTCTMNPNENQRSVEKLARNRSEAALLRTWTTPEDSPLGEFFFTALLAKA